MPCTFLRILAAVIYRHITAKCEGLLHSAQLLINTFREPQGNDQDMPKHVGMQRHLLMSHLLGKEFYLLIS